MPFGNRANLCRVYEYGCLVPIQGERELIDSIFKRNRLWNKLVEIDRLFEEKFHILIKENAAQSGFDLNALEREVAFLRDLKDAFMEEAKRLRQKARSGKAKLPQRMQQDFACLKPCLQRKSVEYKEAKKRVREVSKNTLEVLENERKATVKKALHSFGLWWCNWGEENTEYDAARRRVLQERAKGKPVSLRFHRFDGTGKVTVRLRERGMAGPWGMPMENIFKPNNAFWIEPVPAEAWEHPIRSVRRKAARTKVHFRIGSDVHKNPVWVVLPMVMHRPLPENGIVRQASVVRGRVGRAFRYKLVVTVELPETKKVPLRKEGVVAVDLGWRKVEGGVRVAYWADDTCFIGGKENGKEHHGELVLPDKMIRAFQKLRNLRSIRDVHFDEAKMVLAEFLRKNSVPDWLKEKLKGLGRWRSQRKLIAVLDEWEMNRFAGDGVFEWLQEWRKREDHLYDWESNLRDQVLRWRREEYRKFAKWLAENYSAVVLEKFDIRGVAEKPAPEKGTQGSVPPDYQRFISAPSELRLCIVNAYGREKVKVSYQPAALTTLRCHVCRHKEKFDAGKDIWRRCPKCGELWDQDYNACINLLKQHFSSSKEAAVS